MAVIPMIKTKWNTHGQKTWNLIQPTESYPGYRRPQGLRHFIVSQLLQALTQQRQREALSVDIDLPMDTVACMTS